MDPRALDSGNLNIAEAKEQIKNAMTAYFAKDEFGGYVIPVESQCPIFLEGPPGIGKTAIMRQIASELDVALLSYTMTHHTRQSAMGLPFISKKSYGGREYDVTEYTMSEIIASVYDMMETTGHTEGILFLDEINCVSETLSPMMLQFLQYKTFGNHRVPDGWIVVTAGNPPEYNASARDFDPVTLDRLKRIRVDASLDAWKEFAVNEGKIHASVLTYLENKKDHFYHIETTVEGKNIVTPRGWSNLSAMIHVYEKNDLKVDEKLIGQYLKNREIAKSFAAYYDLFNKYRADYRVSDILEGRSDPALVQRAKRAGPDEQLALVGLLLDSVLEDMRHVVGLHKTMELLIRSLSGMKLELSRPGADALNVLDNQIRQKRAALERGKLGSSMSLDEQYATNAAIAVLEGEKQLLLSGQGGKKAPKDIIEQDIRVKRMKTLKDTAKKVNERLSNAFKFCDEVFGSDGNGMLYFVTELTRSSYGVGFIGTYGSEDYYKYNRSLLINERQLEILRDIEELKL